MLKGIAVIFLSYEGEESFKINGYTIVKGTMMWWDSKELKHMIVGVGDWDGVLNNVVGKVGVYSVDRLQVECIASLVEYSKTITSSQ